MSDSSLPLTSPLSDYLDLSQDDLHLHATLDFLFMQATVDRPNYNATVKSLLALETQYQTRLSASDWARHISGCAHAMGAEIRYVAAAVIAWLTGTPDILHRLIDIEKDAALGEPAKNRPPDLERLRQLHATLIASVLRPLLKRPLGSSKEQTRLDQDAKQVRLALQEWTATHLKPDFNNVQPDNTNQNGMSILLVLSWFPADPHKGAHLKQIMSYMHGLMIACRETGQTPVRIKLLLTYDNHTTLLAQNFQSYSRSNAQLIEDSIRNALGQDLAEDFSIEHIIPQNYENTEAWLKTLLTCVEDFKPNAIVRWYGFYATNAIAPALHARWPVVGIQFNATNTVDPYADILLKQGTLTPDLAATDLRWRSHRIPLEVLPRRMEMTRAQTELPEDAFTLVSTLSGGRLEKAILSMNMPHLNDILALFDTYPDLIWVWVGVVDSQQLKNHDPRLASLIETGRIRCVAFSEDLRAFYRHCDLYVHLPRMAGGGMGVAMATAEDVAIVCHAGSDPCNFLPEDTIANDWEHFYELLTQTIESPDLRQSIATKQAQWLETSHSIRGIGHEVLDFINTAQEIRLEKLSGNT